MTDLFDLISRLESATEGSRELDCAIALATGYDHEEPADRFLPASTFSKRMPILIKARPEIVGQMADVYQVPRYTTSLDAAVKLIPGGYSWNLTCHPEDAPADSPAPLALADVYRLGPVYAPKPGYIDRDVIDTHGGWSSSAPLALCIASLRALERQRQAEGATP
jgi:hypothetical protein